MQSDPGCHYQIRGNILFPKIPSPKEMIHYNSPWSIIIFPNIQLRIQGLDYSNTLSINFLSNDKTLVSCKDKTNQRF